MFEGEDVPWLLRKEVVFVIAAGFLTLVTAYVALAAVYGLSFEFDAGPFKDWVAERGALGPVVFIAVMALAVLFAPIPNTPVFLAAGLAWGWLLGSVYSLAGMMIGSVLAFYVARWLGRRHLPRLIGAKAAQRLDSAVEDMGGRVIFWARMLPATNFDWLSFLAGMTAMRFWTFFVFSFLGMIVPTVLSVAAGDGLAKDTRVTLLLVGLWVVGIVASAAFFWGRRKRPASAG